MNINDWLDPRRYDHPVDAVELVETHISWVLLAGAYAYKVKKPVTLPFLDYGSVDRRRAFCEAELRLNRRFAPDLYLGVADLDGEPAVKMRRFDEACRLDHVCRRGELTPAHLSTLARTIAAFHAGAEVAAADTPFGTPPAIAAATLENFEELERLAADHGPRLTRLRAWTEAELARLAPVFTARRAAGCVRECHGDLHLGNLVLLDAEPPPDRSGKTRSTVPERGPEGAERVVPFDCIEFNDSFRWIDVASELAFTYVDLLDHERPGLACWLLNEWLLHGGDFGALAVLRSYAVYRALVRAKVAGIGGHVDEMGEYLAMAEGLTAPAAPSLTITFGLSGSGKTTVTRARLLADAHATTIRLRSDVERKRLYGLAPDADSGGTIYGTEATQRTYARLLELARAALADGWSVIVDAAFLKRAERDTFSALATAAGVPFAILSCAAPAEELRRRLHARHGDASEADESVLEQQLRWVEPLASDEGPIVAG